MKMNKLAIVLGATMALCAGAVNAGTLAGSGTKATTDSTHVYFDGTITNAPCSMPSGSRDQHINMGSISATALKKNGTSDPQEIKFNLKDCPAGDTVTVTFSGVNDPNVPNDSTLLSLGSGQASGAGIQILSNGKAVTLGTATDEQTLGEGDNTLSYTAQLKADGKDITTGDFSSVANVLFTYN